MLAGHLERFTQTPCYSYNQEGEWATLGLRDGRDEDRKWKMKTYEHL